MDITRTVPMPASTTAVNTEPQQDSKEVAELKTKIGALVEKRFNQGQPLSPEDSQFLIKYEDAFNAFETNGDLGIDKKELIALLKEAKVGNGVTRGMWADGVIDHMDSDNDGKIQWNEFRSALASPPATQGGLKPPGS